jgi:hypothetical protein
MLSFGWFLVCCGIFSLFFLRDFCCENYWESAPSGLTHPGTYTYGAKGLLYYAERIKEPVFFWIGLFAIIGSIVVGGVLINKGNKKIKKQKLWPNSKIKKPLR